MHLGESRSELPSWPCSSEKDLAERKSSGVQKSSVEEMP